MSYRLSAQSKTKETKEMEISSALSPFPSSIFRLPD
jgi:hypothetical protein